MIKINRECLKDSLFSLKYECFILIVNLLLFNPYFSLISYIFLVFRLKNLKQWSTRNQRGLIVFFPGLLILQAESYGILIISFFSIVYLVLFMEALIFSYNYYQIQKKNKGILIRNLNYLKTEYLDSMNKLSGMSKENDSWVKEAIDEAKNLIIQVNIILGKMDSEKSVNDKIIVVEKVNGFSKRYLSMLKFSQGITDGRSQTYN
tara:strand:+ start:5736 stop:6350 length:615 start_codon:yes stop_codon:yes gene_type:complete